MKWRQTMRLLRGRVKPEVAYAMDYLELHGQQFCVHFGTQNAIEKAAALYVDGLPK